MPDTTRMAINPPVAGEAPRDTVVRLLHDVVVGTDHVDRLVPSLKDALSRLPLHRNEAPVPSESEPSGSQPGGRQPGGRHGPSDTINDGIALSVQDDVITATLDVGVRTGASVLATALAVQSAADAVLRSASGLLATRQLRTGQGGPDAAGNPVDGPGLIRVKVKVNVLGLDTSSARPGPPL